MFKSRKHLKTEIDYLTEQLRIESEARKTDAARHRREITQLEDKCKFLADSAKTLKSRLEELLDAEREINRLRKELNEMKDLNAGLGSTVTDLKRRNETLARRLRQSEEKRNTQEPKASTCKKDKDQ